MSKKVYFDAGHGGTDPGAVKYEIESHLNIKVVNYAVDYLTEHFEVEVYKDVTNASTSEIASRANKWNADLFVSVHFNAGGGDGFEALVYSSGEKSLGVCFEKYVKQTGQNSRGVKYRPDLNVLRLTKMKAVLCEIAFVDNKKDISDWNEDHELQKMGRALALACADWLDLPVKSATYMTLETMNFREKPDLKSKVLEVIPKGTVLVGTEVSGGWLNTTHKRKSGFVRIEGQKIYMKKM